MIAAFVLVAATIPAMAFDGARSGINDDLFFDYLSWCEGNKVMASTQSGQPYMRFNCEDQGLVCKTFDVSRFYGQNRVIYSAACDKK